MTYSAIIQELQQIKASLASIKPVKLESRVQWTGLIGAAQDMWADRKAKKLCDTKIINDTNYLNLPFLLAKRAKELEEYLSVSSDVNESITFVVLVQECYKIWNSICPEIAYWTVEGESWNNHPLPISLVVKHQLYNSFHKYNLPEELKKETGVNMRYVVGQIEKIINPQKDKNSGCLGILLLMVIPATALYFLLG